MKSILEMTINEMAGAEFDCDCGHHHKLDIRHIAIGKGVLPEILSMAAPFKGKKGICAFSSAAHRFLYS